MIFSWFVHDFFMICSLFFHDLFMICSWFFHDFFMIFSWFFYACFRRIGPWRMTGSAPTGGGRCPTVRSIYGNQSPAIAPERWPGGFQNIASRCSQGHNFGILAVLFLTSFSMICSGCFNELLMIFQWFFNAFRLFLNGF